MFSKILLLNITHIILKIGRDTMPLTLMYITNNPAIAKIAEKNGVERIWVDLEVLGKEERQHNINTVKSHHCIQDIRIISNLLETSEMLVRINPLNETSEKEINQVIIAGADLIMLPMWKTPKEVKEFLKFVKNRTKTILLLETKEAVECIDEVLEMGGFDEIHIGLNDLHLSYGLTFMFELLANGLVETLCKKFKKAGIPYGFGGIACIGEGLLPAESIIMEHYRLGSTRAILSRSFCNIEEFSEISKLEKSFSENLKKLREFETKIDLNETQSFLNNIKYIQKCVEEIVKRSKNKNENI